MKQFEFTKRIADADRFLHHLRSGGYKAQGVAIQESKVFVQPEEGETRSPEALVKAYSNQDYFEFTAADRKPLFVREGIPTFPLKRDGKDVLIFTVTKKNGATETLKPDTEEVDFHWHGTKVAWVPSLKIPIKKGVGTVQVGRIFVPGGGLCEAVHPTEAAFRGTAYIQYMSV